MASSHRHAWLLFGLLVAASSHAAPLTQWIDQQGTSTYDQGMGVSADGFGGAYTCGYTGGSFAGASAGSNDAILMRHDSTGSLAWARQLGTSSAEGAYGVSSDALGNVYIAGATDGSLGGPNAGGNDAFVSRYDSSGAGYWTRQLGTSLNDIAFGASTDGAGNVYIAGDTDGVLGGPSAGWRDAFVAKYNSSGVLQWVRQMGTSTYDNTTGVSADGLGNVYICGYTQGAFSGSSAGGTDAYVAKYNELGVFQWVQQFGTSSGDTAHSLSADGLGNVYVSGATGGSLGGPSAGGYDAFLVKFSDAGAMVWARQLGSANNENGGTADGGVCADGAGAVYMSGSTWGSIEGVNAGSMDAFVSKYDDAGNLIWVEQYGTAFWDGSQDVAADSLGNVFTTGSTTGSLEGTAAGHYDVYVASFREPVPQLATTPPDGGTLSFGHVLVGQTGTQTLTAANSGEVGSSLTGTLPDASGEFSPGSTEGFTLGQGESQDRDYTYTPTARGADSQDVTVTSDGGDSTVTLSGQGVAPVCDAPATQLVDFGKVLVGTSKSMQVAIGNIGDGNLATGGPNPLSNLNFTLTAVSHDGLSGAAGDESLPDGAIYYSNYSYDPVGNRISETDANGNCSNGSPDGTNSAYAFAITVRGEGVCPIQDTTLTNAGTVRVGDTDTVQVSIVNIGNGNESGEVGSGDPSLPGGGSNLIGSLPALVGTFASAGAAVDLHDGGSMDTLYTYEPTTRGTHTQNVLVTFDNGSADGTNSPETVLLAFQGTGVGPVCGASQPFGSMIGVGVFQPGDTGSVGLDVWNETLDLDLGPLTDLTLLSYEITGPEESLFDLSGFVAGMVLGKSETVALQVDFLGAVAAGLKTASLSFLTDQSAPFGTPGDVFTFGLSAEVKPEPTTLALLALGGLGLLRRRRRKR